MNLGDGGERERERGGGDSLLKLNVNGSCRQVRDGAEGRGREDDGGTGPRRPGHRGGGPVDDPDLDGTARDAGPGHGRADAADQILPPARRPVVPCPVPRCPEQVARRELRGVAPVAGRSCIRRTQGSKTNFVRRILVPTRKKAAAVSSSSRRPVTYVCTGGCSGRPSRRRSTRGELPSSR